MRLREKAISLDNEQRVERQKREEQELRMVTERSKQEKNRRDEPDADGFDHLGYGISSTNMGPIASSSGSSNAGGSGSGSPEEGSSQPRKVVMQTNNPYATAVSNTEAAPAVLPDRYIVDEPVDDTPPSPPVVASSHGVAIGDKNPFGAYMKQREESVDVPTPKEPSAKALGKLRRVSGQDSEWPTFSVAFGVYLIRIQLLAAEVEEQNRRLEEQLRQKYAQQNLMDD